MEIGHVTNAEKYQTAENCQILYAKFHALFKNA